MSMTSRTTNRFERAHRAEKVRTLSALLLSTFGNAPKLPELVETMEATLWNALVERALGKGKTASAETRAELVTFLRASATVEKIAANVPAVHLVTAPRTVSELYSIAAAEGDRSLATACSMVLKGTATPAARDYVASALKLHAAEAVAA